MSSPDNFMTTAPLDGDKLLRDLRLPYFTIAMLREMKVGDYFELFDVSRCVDMDDKEDYPTASARIERVKGGYSLSALWMLHVGKVKKRGHMFVPGVTLKLMPGRRFEIRTRDQNEADVSIAGLRLFIRIVRLTHRLSRMAAAVGEKGCERKLRPSVTGHEEERCGYVVPFLNRMAAPPLR